MIARLRLACCLLGLIPILGLVSGARAGDHPPLGVGVHVAPEALSPGETGILHLRVVNTLPDPVAFALRGEVRFEEEVIAEFDLRPLELEPLVERGLDHPLVIPETASFGPHEVVVVALTLDGDEPIGAGATRFAVVPESPLRLGLEIEPDRTHPGGAVLLQVALQNRTEEPLEILVGGRVLRDGVGVGPIPPRALGLHPGEVAAVRIPLEIPPDFEPGIYGAEVVAGVDLREPLAAGHAPFAVVPPAPAMVGAVIRPEVTQAGETIRISTRVQNTRDEPIQLLMWGFLHSENAPVRFFGPRPLQIAPTEAVENTMPFRLPEFLPPGRYFFETWVGPAPGIAFDHSVAGFVIRPADG